MREIKFRAWDKEKKQMWHFPLWGIPQAMEEGIGLVKDIEVMQFTGLLDKNGKEIYEGDSDGKSIVKFDSFDEEDVEYDGIMGEISGWYIENINTGNCLPLTPKRAFNFEIIGNIYENPELLKS